MVPSLGLEPSPTSAPVKPVEATQLFPQPSSHGHHSPGLPLLGSLTLIPFSRAAFQAEEGGGNESRGFLPVLRTVASGHLD